MKSTPAITTSSSTTGTIAIESAVAHRKSLRGKWGKVGAPPKTLKFKSGSFTIAEIAALNPSVCELTVRKHILNEVESGKFVRLAKDAKKPGVGRPNFRFMTKAQFDSLANLSHKKGSKGKDSTKNVPVTSTSDSASVSVPITTVNPATMTDVPVSTEAPAQSVAA